MYGALNPIDRIDMQIKELETIKKNYQNVPPINNIINQTQPQYSQNNTAEIKILNDGEDVMNIGITTKTLFIGDSEIALKSTDGTLERWEVKKIYPIDKKDQKINELEKEIKMLKEMINNEHPELTKPIQSSEQQTGLSNVTIKTKPKTSDK